MSEQGYPVNKYVLTINNNNNNNNNFRAANKFIDSN